MSAKLTALAGLIILSISAPLTAIAAADLIIVNNTNQDSTSVMNGGPCSSILGPNGISRAHSTNVVPQDVVKKACIFNRTNCRAQVHMTADCRGPSVATVTFDTNTGIKSIHLDDASAGYTVTGSGFTASISGGPALSRWFHKLFG